MIERRPLWPPGAAALAEPQLAERQGEVVGDDEQVAERGVLAGEHLADGEPRVVHVGERLDERQVEAADSGPSTTFEASRWRPLPGPAGPLGEPVHDQPADVVARPRVLRPGVPETDDDLQPRPSAGQHDRARSRSGRARGDGSRARRPRPTRPSARARRPQRAAGARGRASRPPRPGRRGPSRRCGARRGSPAAAARRPATSGRRRSGRRGRPRPARSPARPRSTMSPRCGRRPGGSAKSAAAAGAAARGPGWAGTRRAAGAGTTARRSGRLAQVGRVERRQLGVVGQDQPDRGRARGARRRRAPRRRPGPGHAPATGAVDAVADGQVDPPRTAVDRPGHEAGPLPRCRRCPRRRPPPAATRARRPCSAGRRSACGTSRAAGRRTPRGSARGRAASGRIRRTGRRSMRSSMIRLTIARIAGSSRDGQRADRRLDAVGEHDQGRLARLRLRAGVAELALVDDATAAGPASSFARA